MNPQAKQIKTNSVRHATPCEPWVCLAWLTSVLGFAARPLPPPLQGDDDALRLWGHPMALCRNPAEAPGGWIYIYIYVVSGILGVLEPIQATHVIEENVNGSLQLDLGIVSFPNLFDSTTPFSASSVRLKGLLLFALTGETPPDTWKNS